jgi:hypothetical protein
MGCRGGEFSGDALTLQAAIAAAGHDPTDVLEFLPGPTRKPGERLRDEAGRFLPEPFPTGDTPSPLLTQADVYARIRRDWYRLPNGAKKPYARELRLPVATVRGIAKGRAGLKARILCHEVPGRSLIIEGGLPQAVRRRLSRVFAEMDRGEWVLMDTGQCWPNGTPRYVYRRMPPRRPRVSREGDAGAET